MQEYDIIVVGGGLSGLTFAYYASLKNKKVLVLEKRATLGGCINSVKPFADSDFFIELGAHTIYSSYGTMIDMIKRMSLQNQIIPQTKRPYKMWQNRKLTSLLSGVSKLDLLKVPLKMIGLKKTGLTVKEYYSKIFGEHNFENLILPVTSAVICQDSSNVAADLLLKSRPKDKSMPRSFTMKGGLNTLMDNIGKQKNITTLKGCTVTSVSKTDSGYNIVTDSGDVFVGGYLVMATTAHEAADLLVPIDNTLAKHLKKLPMHISTAYGIAVKSEYIQIPPFGYAIGKKNNCRAAVSRDVVPDSKYRGITFHMKDNSDFRDSLDEIHDVFKITKNAPIKTQWSSYLLPELKITHFQWKDELEEITSQIPNFVLLGNFYGGLSMEDCAIKGKEMAEKIS